MKKNNLKRKVTLESLAGMVKRGFDDVEGRVIQFQKENKQEHKEIKKKLDNIELRLSAQYKRRIEILENKVARLEELLAVR